MFATISYNSNDPDDEVRVVPASAQYFGGRRLARLACTECRAKKVKCTGEKTGCAKCRNNGIQCVYPTSSERGGQGRRRTTVGITRHNSSNSITSAPTQRNSVDKDNSTSPTTKNDSRPPSYIDSDLSSVAPSLDMDTDFNDLLSTSTPLPSPDADSFLGCPTFPLFDLSSKDLTLNTMNMGDDFGFDLNQLCSPKTQPFGDLSLDTPGSTVSMTPSHGSNTPELRQMTPPTSSLAARNILFDIQNSLGDLDTAACSCSASAVHMLEELELKDYNDIELSTDVVLNKQKLSLAQFHSWLQCDRCPTPMATSMLLALIIERVSLYLEKGVAHYVREQQQGIKVENSAYTGPAMVGEYTIESRHEWGQVMRVLLLVRGRELSNAVEKLKKRAMVGSMLAGTERRITRIISELTSWEA